MKVCKICGTPLQKFEEECYEDVCYCCYKIHILNGIK